MKNNTISSSQFYFSMFLSTLVSFLFIDISASYQQIIYVIIAELINFLVLLFYKGENNIVLRCILCFYFFFTSVTVMNKFIVFMNAAVKSGPYWVLILIITATIFFCCGKGFEALTRAAVIISFFVVLFLLYIFSSTLTDLRLEQFIQRSSTGLFPALILLFPSAVFASLGDAVKDNKKYPLIVYSISTSVIMGYYIFLASSVDKIFPLYNLAKNSHMGIFKGSDFLFLTLITIGVIFFLCTAILSVSANKSGKRYHYFYLLAISLVSLISLYFIGLGDLFNSSIVHLAVTILMLTAVIGNSVYYVFMPEHKNCNKSKKS